MVADLPPYPEVVYFVYTSIDDECRNFAFWLYQRLKYINLPVRIHGADNGIGGSGFHQYSIERAMPLIAVVSNISDKYSNVFESIEQAQEQKKNVNVVIYEEVEVPPKYINDNTKIFDFRLSWEQKYKDLEQDLSEHQYPKLRESYGLDTERYLNMARRYAHDDNIFMRDYNYINIFESSFSSLDKIQAIQDMAQLGILSGIVLANLTNDPDENVRATAALAISKYGNSKHIPILRQAISDDNSDLVKLYANISLKSYSNKDILPSFHTNIANLFYRHEIPLPKKDYLPSFPSNTNKEHKIFISYARKDAENFAIELKNTLDSKQYPTWLDTNLQASTQNWSREIEIAIKKSSVVLVLLSPAVHDSDWILNEVQFAQQHEKPIIPVFVLETEKPIYLGSLQGLRGEPIYSKNSTEVVGKLLQALDAKGIKPNNFSSRFMG